MPIESVPNTDFVYYLIVHDEQGNERAEPIDGVDRYLSDAVIDSLRQDPVTDVFVMSHGWKGDVPAARDQYRRWISAMAVNAGDRERMRATRPGFLPLMVGLHWPSLPWGDEELGVSASFSIAADAGVTAGAAGIDPLVDEYARRIADTPVARAALRRIFEAALVDIAPARLSEDVRKAYEILNAEAGLGSDGVGGAPGADRDAFDAEGVYQLARAAATSYGAPGLTGLLDPLRQLSFWKMKDRARRFGEGGAHRLLTRIEIAAPRAHIHLMGHSFGCIVVSAMLAGPGGHGRLQRSVGSLVLVQGALSLWSYCADIPAAPGTAGYFHSIVRDRRVNGPIVTTQSTHDTAVGRFYPMGAGVARQLSYAPGELPRYGAVGAYGIRGLDDGRIVDLAMLPLESTYDFRPGRIYNLESSAHICDGSGLSGAHSDISKPCVAHAVWEAARQDDG